MRAIRWAILSFLAAGCGGPPAINISFITPAPSPSDTAVDPITQGDPSPDPLIISSPSPSTSPSPDRSPVADPIMTVKLFYKFTSNSPIVCVGHDLNPCEISRNIKASYRATLAALNPSCTWGVGDANTWVLWCSTCFSHRSGCDTLYVCLKPAGTSATACEWDPDSTTYP